MILSIVAMVALSAPCKTLLKNHLDDKKVMQQSNLALSLRHDSLISCLEENASIAEGMQIIDELDITNSALLERAMNYLRGLNKLDDFVLQVGFQAAKPDKKP